MEKSLHQQVKDYAKMYHLPFDIAKITVSKWFPPEMGKELAKLKE
ncbi:MAG: hypothetical protein OXC46_09785 [Thaumarchaeota archaeon]|nr:hypothetical protein [Nitrososphaerota archaeon]